MALKYNWLINDTLADVSIEKSDYDNKSHFYDGFCAYRGLS